MLFVAACSSNPSTDASGSSAATGGSLGSGVSSAPVPGSQEDLVVQVGDRVFFDTDRSDLRPDQQATVEKLAAWLRRNDNVHLVLEGHADERGTREYNLALGERRANSVRASLIAYGIPASRLSTISYGKERPEVVGSTEYAWAQNRRVVFVVS